MIFFVCKCRLFEILSSVLMVSRWFLFEILSLLAPSSLHPPSLDNGHWAAQEHNWAQTTLAFLLFHQSLHYSTPYAEICITEWLKWKRIMSPFITFTLLTLHLTGP